MFSFTFGGLVFFLTSIVLAQKSRKYLSHKWVLNEVCVIIVLTLCYLFLFVSVVHVVDLKLNSVMFNFMC